MYLDSEGTNERGREYSVVVGAGDVCRHDTVVLSAVCLITVTVPKRR